MAHYGSATPKRHCAFSTSPAVSKLNLGKLVGWMAKIRKDQADGKEAVKTVIKYHDKSGNLRYKGTSKLKPTESDT